MLAGRGRALAGGGPLFAAPCASWALVPGLPGWQTDNEVLNGGWRCSYCSHVADDYAAQGMSTQGAPCLVPPSFVTGVNLQLRSNYLPTQLLGPIYDAGTAALDKWVA